MKSQIITRYDHPDQFLPLMPEEHMLGPVLELASDLTRAATAMAARSAAAAQDELRSLLRHMNSYYTNKLEGDHTRPSDIERALHADFSANADLARRQHLAVAHIETEKECEDTIEAKLRDGVEPVMAWLYSTDALQWMHGRLFSQLRPRDLLLADGSSMQPGALRTAGVAVGSHEAPVAEAVPRFLARWQDTYRAVRRGEACVVAAAASHHRLAWVHPFFDGNGRVARLHTHLLMFTMGLSCGLWSPLRGFARTEDEYRAHLKAADEHRHGALDGRGNLTQAGLLQWIEYTLKACIDQVTFMERQLDIAGMKERITAALAFEESQKTGVRTEALRALHYLFAAEHELPRADFKGMLGLGDRLATATVSALLNRGFLATDSAYGKLRFAIPKHALRFYFPALWPEAEQDEALLAAERRQRDQKRAGA
jgi:Fic family protein